MRQRITPRQRESIDTMDEFGALMKFCQKCFKEFPTEEEASKHEAKCTLKPDGDESSEVFKMGHIVRWLASLE